ncbi:MAG: T9SS type A sorting domain-containing protein [Saprospiraceae bacterium]|nr:T9SS type A sorting domain-containing protein [Saprospiraceae bacterium]
METDSMRLEVSPNPTTGITQIQSNHPVQKVIIRNIQGDFIESKYFVQESKIELDLSHLTSSVYLVEIQSGTGERIFKKIIRAQ